ncbi:MAG: substrate-binding domain-containing protein [Betaproteobacteria bacterium]
MSVHVEFALSWLASNRLSAAHATTLIRLLDAVRASGSLKRAAARTGLSYRFAWGLLGEGAEAFGAPLVHLERGRGARPSPLGEKLLWADKLVHATIAPQFGALRQQIDAELTKALPQRLRRIVIHASHDLALHELKRIAAAEVEIELVFRGAEESLAGLADGSCDLAGFHVADALPRAAAAAAALGRWLDTRKHLLIHFVTREQGLIARPDSHIRSVHDLARPGVRFINRQSGSTASLTSPDDDSVAAAVASGRADAGFGLRADALRYQLDFVPLALERYFLACARSAVREPTVQRLLETLKANSFTRRVALLPGYDATDCGKRESLSAALNWVEGARRGSRRAAKR